MKNVFVLLIIFLSLSANAQTKQDDYKFSKEIETELAKGDRKFSASRAALYYTLIGKYKEALSKTELEPELQLGMDHYSMPDSIAFTKYQTKNAFDYFAEQTKKEKVVIISEAHHKPQHRVFTRRLLKQMYDNGFRHLGLETVNPNFMDSTINLLDTLLNQRGYPLNSPFTGTYSREPQMANMIREAINLGFTIFAYERLARGADRDLQQAQNIHRYMKAHPNGKFLIHCGWFHAVESHLPKGRKNNWMAHHLKNRFGIDPYTIYLDALTEKALYPNSPYFEAVESNDVSILLSPEGKVLNGADTLRHFDAMVYFPPTTFVKSRPNWLLNLKGNQLVEVNRSKINSYPIIVKAIKSGESENAMPIDVIEIIDEQDDTHLVLPKGQYNIKLVDQNQNTSCHMIYVK